MKRYTLLLIAVLLTGVFVVSAQDSGASGPITVDNAANVMEIAALEGHDGAVNSVAFSPDGTVLASGGDDETIRIWNLATEESQAVITNNSPVHDLAFPQSGPASGLLFSVGQDSQFWDYTTGENVGSSSGTGDPAYSVAVSSDGRLLTMGQGDSVLLLNLSTMMFSMPAYHDGEVRSLAFQPDTNVLASGGADGVIKFTQITPASQRPSQDTTRDLGSAEADMGEVYSVAYSPDGTMLATGSADAMVRTWDVTDFSNASVSATLSGHTGAVTGVAFSPDGTLLASSGEDGTLRLWNVETQEEIAVLSGPDGTEFKSVAFSPDSTLIASAGSDGVVRLWGVGAGTGGDSASAESSGEGIAIQGNIYVFTDVPMPDSATVELLDATKENGDPNQVIDTQALDSNGGFAFTNLPQGDYLVALEWVLSQENLNAVQTDRNFNCQISMSVLNDWLVFTSTDSSGQYHLHASQHLDLTDGQGTYPRQDLVVCP